MAIIISLFFIKKSDYIKSVAVISPIDSPINITTDTDIKVKDVLKHDGQFVKKEENVIFTKDINSEKEQIKYKLQYKKHKLEDLSKLYEKIEKYPLVLEKKINSDYSNKYFENYKTLYHQIDYKDDLQINTLKSQNLNVLSEKIDTLKDEVNDLSSIKKNSTSDFSTDSGYIFYPKETQVGSIIPKGNVLYQIYKSKDKEIIVYVTSEDILNLNNTQKVSIRFKTKKEEFYLKGKVKYISNFPEETKNNEIFYKVKITLKDKLPKQLENVYYLKGTSYIELEKESIAQYLYRKIKE